MVCGEGRIVKGILYRVADIKGGLRGRGYCYAHIVSCRGYQVWSKGGSVFVKDVLYLVADIKAGLRGRGFC